MRNGLLVIGHGTRDERGVSEFRELVTQLSRRLPDFRIQESFIELVEPGIVEGTRLLAAKGVTHAVACPLLLFAAGHAKVDIPTALRDAQNQVGVSFLGQTPAISLHPGLVAAAIKRLSDCLDTLSVEIAGSESSDNSNDPSEIAWILVGRGSKDEEAIVEMAQFREQVHRSHPQLMAHTAFIAMAAPSVSEVFERVSEAGSGRNRAKHVIVQPHLLFRGRLLDQLIARVDDFQEKAVDQTWHLSQHLGPDPAIVEVLADQILQIPSL